MFIDWIAYRGVNITLLVGFANAKVYTVLLEFASIGVFVAVRALPITQPQFIYLYFKEAALATMSESRMNPLTHLTGVYTTGLVEEVSKNKPRDWVVKFVVRVNSMLLQLVADY